MHLLNRINTSLSVVIFAACVAAFAVIGLSGKGWQALSIPTGSMRPGMPPGSLALVHRVPDNSLKVGDVITYANPLRPGTTLSHRIIKKILIDGKVPGFVTKGDANKVADVPIVAGAIEGKVIWHAPHVGAWLLWAKTWAGLSVLVYVPALLIVTEEILRLNAYYRSLEPYRLIGYRLAIKEATSQWKRKLALGGGTAAAVVFAAGILGPPVEALLTSNTVSLTKNTISVAPASSGNHTCSGTTHNSTTTIVNSATTQSATSGSTTVSGNTGGGSATSGSASNNSSTTVTVTTSNC